MGRRLTHPRHVRLGASRPKPQAGRPYCHAVSIWETILDIAKMETNMNPQCHLDRDMCDQQRLDMGLLKQRDPMWMAFSVAQKTHNNAKRPLTSKSPNQETSRNMSGFPALAHFVDPAMSLQKQNTKPRKSGLCRSRCEDPLVKPRRGPRSRSQRRPASSTPSPDSSSRNMELEASLAR